MPSALLWYDASSLGVAQRGPWPGFARLPHQAQAVVRSDVWQDAQASSGVVVYFDSARACNEFSINVTLTDSQLDEPHMPVT